MIIVYLAGPLFSLAEREFNRQLAAALSDRLPGVTVILPQERAQELLKKSNGLELVFQDCLTTLDQSNVVVAVLDGADADSGTCIELGYAFARGKPIVGIRTDFRASEDRGLNLMVSHICDSLIAGNFDNLAALAEQLAPAIELAVSAKMRS